MVARGLCHGDRASIDAQVKELMKSNDEAFESFKKVVAKTQVKTANRLPTVGVINDGSANDAYQSEDLVSQYGALFSSSKKMCF